MLNSLFFTLMGLASSCILLANKVLAAPAAASILGVLGFSDNSFPLSAATTETRHIRLNSRDTFGKCNQNTECKDWPTKVSTFTGVAICFVVSSFALPTVRFLRPSLPYVAAASFLMKSEFLVWVLIYFHFSAGIFMWGPSATCNEPQWFFITSSENYCQKEEFFWVPTWPVSSGSNSSSPVKSLRIVSPMSLICWEDNPRSSFAFGADFFPEIR